MSKSDQIATYYSNARELVKRNNPKAARSYILLILNAAVESYYSAASILTQAKTAVFLDKWFAVSRDLYDKGITDYVLKCFALSSDKIKSDAVKTDVPDPKKSESSDSDDSALDIPQFIDEIAETQGWCAKVFDANISAVVGLHVVESKLHVASGTGFIISENGYLLTNSHVVFDKESGGCHKKIYMSFLGREERYAVQVLFSDKENDVALCKFDPSGVPGFSCVKRISDYSRVMPGADCLVVGNAFGMGLAPFSGIVRFVRNDDKNLVYTAPSNPGDSGGPVFNRSGECIGINKSKIFTVNGSAAEGYANATPMDTIENLLRTWTKDGDIRI